jgi:chromosome condensin MukBEF complex kleisin-like MukF subunit
LPIALETIMNLRTSRTATFLLWAAGLIVTVALEATAGERVGNAADQNRLVGVFTGRFANGNPIYQLPPITVVANRKAEFAKIEGQSARARAVSRGARRTAAGVDLQPGGV